MVSENPMDEGGGQTFRFTHQEIDYVITVLDAALVIHSELDASFNEKFANHVSSLRERFNKVKFDNRIEVPIELDEKNLDSLCFELEMDMEMWVEEWEPGLMFAKEYEEMALCCTILAKLIEDPEDGGGGSAAAA